MEINSGKLPSVREWFLLLLLALPLVVTASAIDAADWVEGLPPLKVLVPCSLILWVFIARSRLPWWIGHPAALLIGLEVAMVLAAFTLSENDGLVDLAKNLGTWFGALGTQEGNRGAVTTGIVLLVVTLLMSYSSVWLAYRHSPAIKAALPGLAVLLVVLTFLPSDFYWYFFMYVLAAAPGIAYRQNGRWTSRSQSAPLLGVLLSSLGLMGLTLAPVWKSPTPEGSIMPLTSKFQGPWYTFQDKWSNMFHGVPDRKQWPSFSPHQELILAGNETLGGDAPASKPIQLTDDVLFTVESELPHRWRMRIYETYTGAGWETDEAPPKMASGQAPLQEYVQELGDRETVGIRIRMYSRSGTLVTVGDPLSASIPYDVELSPRPSFKLYLEGPQLSPLPPGVDEHSKYLVFLLNSAGAEDETQVGATDSPTPRLDAALSNDPLSADLSALGLRLRPNTGPVADESEEESQETEAPSVMVERASPVPGPPLAFLSHRRLLPLRQYETVGSLSIAARSEDTRDKLREAGGDYPQWVTDRYLQLPEGFPLSVNGLASHLTKSKSNPHDMAKAIEGYLNNLSFTRTHLSPPPGADWVDYFLQSRDREGFSVNYASAMVTMLRSVGIPSRMAVGFAPGIYREEGLWEVQALHYHAWPEVYFPNFGWVEFEPTPADVQPSLQLLGKQPQGNLIRTFRVDDFTCLDDPARCYDPDAPGVGEEFALYEIEDLIDASEEDASAGAGSGLLTSPWSFLGIGLTIPLIIALGIVTYYGWTRSRMAYVASTYGSMCALGRLSGSPIRPQDTPWEYRDRLSRALPDQTEPIADVTQKFVHHRYGGPSDALIGQEMWSLRASWRSLQRALFGRILRRLIPFRG